MREYIARRLLVLIPVLLGITIVIFTLFEMAPGDAVSGMITPGLTPARKEELRHTLGLDKPGPQRYFIWLSNIVKGELGESIRYKKPVAQVMKDHIWNSFYLALPSLLLSFLLAIPIGVMSATRQHSAFDTSMTIVAMIGISLPSFYFVLLLVKWFAVDLAWLPPSGMHTPGYKPGGFLAIWDVIKHMIIPVVVYTYGSVAGLMRYMRSAMLEVVEQDYIRTARSKGLKERVVIYKHALRNALIPVVTIFGMSLAGLFAGGMITESIVGWPGIGQVMLNAINGRDYQLLMGYYLVLSAITLLGNLLADVAYAVVDPRIRLK